MWSWVGSGSFSEWCMEMMTEVSSHYLSDMVKSFIVDV